MTALATLKSEAGENVTRLIVLKRDGDLAARSKSGKFIVENRFNLFEDGSAVQVDPRGKPIGYVEEFDIDESI